MKCLVTGAAGFIGSVLTERLLADGHEVVGYDNLSSGNLDFLKPFMDVPRFKFVEADLLDVDKLKDAMDGVEIVFHIAANPDIRLAEKTTRADLENGVIATYSVLECMRELGVKKIVFSSSSVIYGEAEVLPTPEEYGPLVPISIYGGAKLGGEGFITSFCHTFGLQAWIFRFANVIGKNGTHGVLVDFIRKLREDPTQLEILGDGSQAKSYLLVEECVDAILFALENAGDEVNMFNLGCEDQVNVTRIAELVVEEMGLSDVKFNYTGGKRGWKGDVPQMMLATRKIRELGWNPKHDSEGAIREAVRILLGK